MNKITAWSYKCQWTLALKRTDKLIHQQNRCAQKATIYEQMGDLKQTLY